MEKSPPQSPALALVVIPTYNERENIEKLLSAVLESAPGVDVLVVDDASPDRTDEVVTAVGERTSRVHLLSREGKQGLGTAYIAGFRWGLSRGYARFIEMDADFSHEPRALRHFLAGLEESDVVVGCRYMPGGSIPDWPWYRRLISRGGNVYARLVLGLPFGDLTGGFNGWRREVLETISLDDVRSVGYAFQIELKLRAHLAGFRLREIPIRFEDRRFGVSKMSGRIVWEAACRVLILRAWRGRLTRVKGH